MLPGSAAEEAGGDPVAALRELALSVGEPGTYAAEVGGSADAPGDGGGGGFPVVLLVLLAVPLGLFALSRRRRSRQEKADTALVKEAARDDLIALGDDIRALDLDVEMPGVDAEAKSHYGVTVERYEQAEQALDSVRRPQESSASPHCSKRAAGR